VTTRRTPRFFALGVLSAILEKANLGTAEFANQISAPEYVRCASRSYRVPSPSSLTDLSRCLSKEHSLCSRGGLVLHVWKHVSISVQREGRAGVSELLRNNFRRHSGCQCDCGRRMAQIIESYSWHPCEVE
jgi:hypothetical protein